MCPFPIQSLWGMVEFGGAKTRRQHLGPNRIDLLFCQFLCSLRNIEILYTILKFYRKQSCIALPNSSALGNNSTCLDGLATFNIHNYLFVKKTAMSLGKECRHVFEKRTLCTSQDALKKMFAL